MFRVFGLCIILRGSFQFLEHYRKQKMLPPLFMKVTAEWDSTSTLASMTRFVQELCALGLIVDPDSELLLSESLLFYEVVKY